MRKMPPGWKIIDSVLTFKTEQILEQDFDYKKSRDIIYGDEMFENFELYVEWKIPVGGNSGILYHIQEGYDGPHEVAPEYQLIDDANYASIHDLTEAQSQLLVLKTHLNFTHYSKQLRIMPCMLLHLNKKN